MADFPCVAVAPISLAYSGSICCVGAVPRTARCQARMNAAKSSTETSAARRVKDDVIREPGSSTSRRSLDREAVHVLLRLGRIEGLAHHDECLACRGGRRQADLFHQLRGVGRQKDLLGNA